MKGAGRRGEGQGKEKGLELELELELATGTHVRIAASAEHNCGLDHHTKGARFWPNQYPMDGGGVHFPPPQV
jgi:hypothetical protein